MSLKKVYSLFFAILLFSFGDVFSSCIGVGCNCTVSASTINFGSYDPLNATSLDANGNVQVTCSVLLAGLNVSYNIALNSGNAGTYSSRYMSLLSNHLNYNLYTDPAQTQIWGNGSSGTSIVSDSYTLNLFSQTRNYAVYGHVPMSQNVAPGAYSDTIQVTVTF